MSDTILGIAFLALGISALVSLFAAGFIRAGSDRDDD